MLDKLLEKFLLKPISIVIATAIAIWHCLNLLPNENESYTKLIFGCIFWFVFLFFYAVIVYLSNKLPSASKGELGILFVFHTETNDMYKDASYNFVEKFNGISSKFDIPLKAICLKSNNIKNYNIGNKKLMLNLLEKTNCVFCVDVLYGVDDVNNINEYEIKINFGSYHPGFNSANDEIFNNRFNQISQPLKNKRFSKDSKLDVLNVTVMQIHLVAKYIIALACIFSEHFILSDKLLQELYTSCNNLNNNFSLLIKEAYFNSCVQMEIHYLDDYMSTENNDSLDKCEHYLQIINELFPNTYAYFLNSAYVLFHKYRNITEAKKCIQACKKIKHDGSHLYSDAFLSAYSEETVVLVINKYEKAIKSDYNIVEIIDFIEKVLIKEPDKFLLHLSLSMLYNELGDKKLSAIHLKSFMNRYKGKKEHYLTKTIKKLQNDKCLTCVNEDCENCEKIAS